MEKNKHYEELIELFFDGCAESVLEKIFAQDEALIYQDIIELPIYMIMNQLDKEANIMMEVGLARIASMDNKKVEAVLYNNLANNLSSSFDEVAPEDLRKALKYAEKGLQLMKDLNDPHGIAKSLGMVGFCNFAMEDYQSAQEYYRSALKETVSLNMEEETAWNSLSLAQTLFFIDRKGYQEEIADLLEDTGRIFTELKDDEGLAELTDFLLEFQ